ncbi:MAG TPA: hypothetical protein VHD35_04910 [Chitinophagaceae bacterium]|nr:hypothetical protein [Chitinophagaceae bacterium]
MKKIFTLIAASLFTMAVFAADHRPSVTVQANKKFDIVIDGKSYSGFNAGTMSIANLRDGYHTVSVYDVQKGFFKRDKRAVATSTFMLRGSDINIFVDMFGKIQVNEIKMGKDRNDYGWDKKDQDKGFGKDSRKDMNDHVTKDNIRHF